MLVKYRGPFKTFNRCAHLIARPVPDVPPLRSVPVVQDVSAVQSLRFVQIVRRAEDPKVVSRSQHQTKYL